MAEKRYLVFASRTTTMTARVYAESEEEARSIVEQGVDLDWDFGNQEDVIDEIVEDEEGEG